MCVSGVKARKIGGDSRYCYALSVYELGEEETHLTCKHTAQSLPASQPYAIFCGSFLGRLGAAKDLSAAGCGFVLRRKADKLASLLRGLLDTLVTRTEPATGWTYMGGKSVIGVSARISAGTKPLIHNLLTNRCDGSMEASMKYPSPTVIRAWRLYD